MLSGKPSADPFIVVSVHGLTPDNWDGWQAFISNATDQAFLRIRVADGGGQGGDQASIALPSGSRALMTVTKASGTGSTLGISSTIEVLSLSGFDIEELADFGTAAISGNEVVAIDDGSGTDKKITLSRLKSYLGGGGSGLTHLRRCAIKSGAGNFVAGDFTTSATGVSTVTNILTTPKWTDGANRRMAFATPTDVPDLSALYFAGSQFANSIGAFEKQSYNLTIEGKAFHLWVSEVLPSLSGVSVQMEP